MPYSILTSLIVLLHAVPALSATFSSGGCYAESDISSYLTNMGSYTYQSTGYCEGECNDYKVAALLDGKYCYCGSTVPASSLQVSDSNCNVPCQGYNQQTCGGDGYFYVYINEDVSGSSMAASSSTAASSESSSAPSTSSTHSSQHSSSSAPDSSSTDAASTSDDSSAASASASDAESTSTSKSSSSASSSSSSRAKASVVTSATTITTDVGGSATPSVIEITTTVSSTASSSPNSRSGSDSGSGSGSKKSLSGGGIAGVVVGVVAGVAIIGLVAFFLWRRRRGDTDDEEFYDDVGGMRGMRQNGSDSINTNPYMDGGAAGAAVAAAGAHGHHNSNTSRSYSSNNEDVFFFDNLNRGDDGLRPPDEEYGRRRLSDGSLPDMVQRNPGSLKVVN